MHWTISRLADYETCPQRYKLRYVDNIQTPSHPAAARGTRIHETAEAFLNSTGPLDEEVSPVWQAMMHILRSKKAHAEEQWEFDRGWYALEEGAELWLRMKLDAWYVQSPGVYRIIDFKTGKFYSKNVDQIEVYALGAFARFDDAETVHADLWYFDSEEPLEKTYHRAQTAKLSRKWEGRAQRMLEDEAFIAKPGKHCNWCPLKAYCAFAA